MSNTKLIGSTGLAYVGGRFSWTGGSLSGGVAEHEWGHNWGVVHANAWVVPQGAPGRSSTGDSAEYQDGWDLMGGNNGQSGFNTLFREELGFIERSRGEVLDVTSSGTYRLYDYIDADSRNATAKVRALLLPMSSFTDPKRVFLGFGHLPGTDGGISRTDWNRNAITVHSGLGSGSHRIDTTPYSRTVGDDDDSSIKIGRTYSEGPNVNGAQLYGGFHVTPIARGSTSSGSVTHEWMDVVVNYGGTSANAPGAAFTESVYTVSVGGSVAMTVNATDADGDALAYDWDFGDGRYSLTNSATQSPTWPTAGLYLVTCTISDMKGNTTRAKAWVNVGAQTQRAADTPAGTLAGVSYRYYESVFTSLPDFNTLLPKREGTVSTVSIAPRDRNDNFAFVFEGFIQAPTDGIYRFHLNCEDGARLLIGGQVVIDNSAIKTVEVESVGSLWLQTGKHAFRVEFFHKDGSEKLELAWSTLTTDRTLIPAESFTRVDPAVNAAPVVELVQPLDGSQFLVNSDVLVEATATDTDGIARVVFFADGSYIGQDATAPYSVVWPKVSVGARQLQALAYDNVGRTTATALVNVAVVSPAPQPSIGINFNPEAANGATMYVSDVAGAVYPQSNWNNATTLNASLSGLLDGTGATTAVAVTWQGTVNNNYGDGSTNADTTTGPGRLFRGLLEIRNDEARRPNAIVSNIPYEQYDVYVYFDLRNNNVKDITPIQFQCVPDDGSTVPSIYGKNSLSSADSIGDYPNYDTWVGYREATATTATAGNDALLGNYVVFRNLTAGSFTVSAERQNPATAQVTGLNAVQIVRATPTIPRVRLLAPAAGWTVAEGGAAVTYTVALSLAPTADVTVTLASGTQLATDKTTLTFTPVNWATPQTVTLRAVDDTAGEGAHTGVLAHTVSESGNYAGVTVGNITVAITDNDQPVISVLSSGLPTETGPVAGRFQFTRTGLGSYAAAQTVAFQLSGAAALSGDYTLTGPGLSYNSATGAGTLTIPAGEAQAFLTVTPVNDTAQEGSETVIATVTAQSGYVLGGASAATLIISDDDVPVYFTQLFSYDQVDTAFDLNGRRLTLTPDGSVNHYAGAISTATAFPNPTNTGTQLVTATLDDSFYTVSQPALFYGESFSTIYVGTNGYITFDSSDTRFSGELATHFTRKRISLFVYDLKATLGTTTIYAGRLGTGATARTVVTYNNLVVAFNANQRYNAQVELFDNGVITITWLNCATGYPVVTGLSRVTTGLPGDFSTTNLSELTAANAPSAPSFASTPPLLGTAGTAYTYGVVATDADNDTLTITAPTKPAWLTLSAGANGIATLTGTPPASGTYDVALQVTDGTTAVPQNFALTVLPAGGVNTVPTFTSTPITTAVAGQTYGYMVAGSDADGHRLSFSASTLPSWLTLTNNGNGTATLAGVAPDTTISAHPVVLQVSDGLEATAQSFTIVLNRAPQLTVVEPANRVVELPDRTDALHLTVAVADDGLPSGGTLTAQWTLVSGPGAANFTDATAVATSVTFAAAGRHHLRLTVSDGTASASIDVVVYVETAATTDTANALYAHWKLDEITGITSAADSSGNDRALALAGAGIGASGYDGGALDLAGTNANYGDLTSFSMPAQATFAAWARLVGSPGATNDRHLFAWRDGSTARFRVYQAANSKRLRIFSDRSTDGLWEAQVDLPGAEWFHVAVSYDQSNVNNNPLVFFNGRAVTVTRITAPVGTQVATSVLRVGNNNNAAWVGVIDDVRVFSRLIGEADLPALMSVAAINRAPDVITSLRDPIPAGSGTGVLAGDATDDGLPTGSALATAWSVVSGPSGVIFADATSPTSSVSFSATGTYVLRLTANDGGARTFSDFSLGISLPTGFTAWIAGQTGVGSATADADDPDRDGLPNLLEYALAGGDPGVANSGIAPVTSLTTVANQTYLTLTYTRRADTVGLTYAVEAGGDLAGWSSAGVVVVSDSGNTVVVRDGTPVSAQAPRRFLRLRVSR